MGGIDGGIGVVGACTSFFGGGPIGPIGIVRVGSFQLSDGVSFEG